MKATRRGVGLLEIVIGLAIVALMASLAAPTFGRWLTNVRIRGTAESMLSGIQFARSEATTRNSRVRFQITSSLDSSCQLSTSSQYWLVDMVTADPATDSPIGACDSAPSDVNAPHILKVRDASETGGGTAIAASTDTIIFNGIGRLVAPAGAVTIDLTGQNAADCRHVGGELTCLRIQVSTSGQVRMCNPVFTSGSDPQAC